MNQDMHIWVASLLMMMTIMGIERRAFYVDSYDTISFIIVAIQLISPLFFFGIWLHRIS